MIYGVYVIFLFELKLWLFLFLKVNLKPIYLKGWNLYLESNPLEKNNWIITLSADISLAPILYVCITAWHMATNDLSPVKSIVYNY
jgi:hypothetical protein